ncbi:hypothetical protein Nmel_008368, partial [Mimus melanotis]
PVGAPGPTLPQVCEPKPLSPIPSRVGTGTDTAQGFANQSLSPPSLPVWAPGPTLPQVCEPKPLSPIPSRVGTGTDTAPGLRTKASLSHPFPCGHRDRHCPRF